MSQDNFGRTSKGTRNRRGSDYFNPTAMSEDPNISVLPRLSSLSRNSTLPSRHFHRPSPWHSLPPEEALIRSLSAPEEQKSSQASLVFPRLSSTPPTQTGRNQSQQYSFMEGHVVPSRHQVLPPLETRENRRGYTERNFEETRRQTACHTRDYPGHPEQGYTYPSQHYSGNWNGIPRYPNTIPTFPNSYMPYGYGFGIPAAGPWTYSYPNVPFVPHWMAPFLPNQQQHINTVVPHRSFATCRPYGYVRRRHWAQISKREAATIIQKTFRGHRVRERIRYLKYISRKRVAYELVEQLIDEYVSSEVIPDLLIEILKEYEAHGGLDPDDPATAVTVIVCEEFIADCIPKISRDAIIEANDEIVQEYMLNSWHRTTDPLTAICEEMIESYLQKEVNDLVHDVTQSIVEDHLAVSRAESCLDQLIQDTCSPLIEGIVSRSLHECHVEHVLDEITDDVAIPLLRGCISAALQECGDDIRQQQVSAVSNFATSRLLDSLILQQLLGHVSDCGDSFTFRLFSQRFLDATLAGFLLQEHWNVYDHCIRTDKNFALKKLHGVMFDDIAVAALTELIASHLDEDMEDIHEQQLKQISYLDVQ